MELIETSLPNENLNKRIEQVLLLGEKFSSFYEMLKHCEKIEQDSPDEEIDPPGSFGKTKDQFLLFV